MPAFFIIVILIAMGITLFTLLEKRFPKSIFLWRKLLHILVILLCSIGILKIPFVPIFCISIFATLGLHYAISKGFFEASEHSGSQRKPWGMVYFAATFTGMTILKTIDSGGALSFICFIALSVLALSDGFAGIVGAWASRREGIHKKMKKWGLPFYLTWGNNTKTLAGFMVFILLTWLILFFAPSIAHQFFPEIGIHNIPIGFDWIILTCIMAFAIALVEMVSSGGSDNLFILLSSIVICSILFVPHPANQLHSTGLRLLQLSSNTLLLYLLGSVILAMGFVRWRLLSASGAVMAWLLAYTVMILAGWSIVFLFAFFLLATLSTKIGNGFGIVNTDSKSGRPRDHWQVLANGGIVMGLAILSSLFGIDPAMFGRWKDPSGSQDIFYLLSLVSVAVACSDTLSSELGMRFGKKTHNIIFLRPIPKGVSGGVSINGLWAAVMGASIIALFSFTVNCKIIGYWGFVSHGRLFFFIASLGFLGSILDSILGALFQVKYQKDNGQLSDTKEKKTTTIRHGFAWCTNDVVNALSNFLIVGIAFCLI